MRIALNWGFDFEISLPNYQFSWSFGTKKEKENYAEITDMSKHLQKDVGVQISSTSNQDYIRYL
ncbi:hypothetical protein [Vibrio penaeicida]|uniref:hypothetical protein n=1 Tax=Vibrio penaeicida TaxID=104609 RepID=UPI000CE9E44C|nr:hypothetical protein [Vibrio penaeicida]